MRREGLVAALLVGLAATGVSPTTLAHPRIPKVNPRMCNSFAKRGADVPPANPPTEEQEKLFYPPKQCKHKVTCSPKKMMERDAKPPTRICRTEEELVDGCWVDTGAFKPLGGSPPSHLIMDPDFSHKPNPSDTVDVRNFFVGNHHGVLDWIMTYISNDCRRVNYDAPMIRECAARHYRAKGRPLYPHFWGDSGIRGVPCSLIGILHGSETVSSAIPPGACNPEITNVEKLNIWDFLNGTLRISYNYFREFNPDSEKVLRPLFKDPPTHLVFQQPIREAICGGNARNVWYPDLASQKAMGRYNNLKMRHLFKSYDFHGRWGNETELYYRLLHCTTWTNPEVFDKALLHLFTSPKMGFKIHNYRVMTAGVQSTFADGYHSARMNAGRYAHLSTTNPRIGPANAAEVQHWLNVMCNPWLFPEKGS